MKIEKGNTRRVFIFKNIVIKTPRVYWHQIFCEILSCLRRYTKMMRKFGIKEFFKMEHQNKLTRLTNKYLLENDRLKREALMKMSIPKLRFYEFNCFQNIANLFLDGIMANYQERKFYRQTKNVFVMPTYFSLFGLINIQEKGDSVSFWKDSDVKKYIIDNSQNEFQPFCDSHALMDVNNFCLDRVGRLRMLDYGSRFVAPFLEINGQALYENFRIPKTT